MSAVWSDQARFEWWLEVECLALEAMEQVGLVPAGSAHEVRARAKIDIARIHAIEEHTKHDVIAFLTQIQESVQHPAAGFLHRGMTSNDLLDTTFACQLVKAGDLLLQGCDKLLLLLTQRAHEFADTLCIARTHGIHAEPTTFGLKLASWVAELHRGKRRLVSALEEVRVGKISGAVGTYSSVPTSVEIFVLSKLGLQSETVATQVVARDRHAVFFAALAGLATSIERWCVEIRHLQRTEVAEVAEPFGRGQKGSSAMPHKRNPILCENLSGLARLVRGYAHSALENVALWHERDISHSSVERIIAPDATILVDFMLHRFASVVAGMTVSAARMQRNLNLTGGLIFSSSVLTALIERGMPRDSAYSLVQRHAMESWSDLEQQTDSPSLAGSGSPFEQRLASDAEVANYISQSELHDLFSAQRMLGSVPEIIKRALSDHATS